MDASDVKIQAEWRIALRDEFAKPYFNKLTDYLKQRKREGAVIYPSGENIFSAYQRVLPQEVKVVIIGQDPYHNPGEAMGMSFSVPKGAKIPPSLKNIYKEIGSEFQRPMPDHGDLTSWTDQGVFLLNSVLTVEKNMPASHKNIGWEIFTNATIAYISTHLDHVVFMLWGNFAKSKKNLIDPSQHYILESAHPSPLAGNAFQGCKHFSKANDYLSSHGKIPIDWQIIS